MYSVLYSKLDDIEVLFQDKLAGCLRVRDKMDSAMKDVSQALGRQTEVQREIAVFSRQLRKLTEMVLERRVGRVVQ